MPGGPGDGGGGEGAAAWGPNSTDLGRAMAVAQPRHPYLDTIVTSLFGRGLAEIHCLCGFSLCFVMIFCSDVDKQKILCYDGIVEISIQHRIFLFSPLSRGPTR